MEEDRERLRHEHQQARDAAARSSEQVAMLRGQVHGVITTALETDNAHRELLRAKAWLRANPTLKVVGDAQKGELRGLPDGWPASVDDPDEHVRQDVATRRDAAIDRLFGQRATPSDERVQDSPSVRRLNDIVAKLNGGQP